MARSDAYYVLKNAADPLLRRLLTMLRLARQKHFFREINWHYREGRYGAGQRLVYLGRWASGLAAGAWAGLTAARRVPLGPTTPSPRPFLRFPHAGPPPTA